MQEGTLPNLVPKASKTPFYLSVLFLISMIVTTIGLLIYEGILSSKISTVQAEISTRQSEIAEVSKDRNVVISRILNSNTVTASLDLKGLIAGFRDVAARANVRLKGFNITKDIITTSLVATEGNPNIHPDPASTIVTMMRAYMTENGDGKFALDPIVGITGDMKQRSTGIRLKVVPNTKK